MYALAVMVKQIATDISDCLYWPRFYFVFCCWKITCLANDDLSFDTSYASVFTMDYTLNRDCLLRADAMAYVSCA